MPAWRGCSSPIPKREGNRNLSRSLRELARRLCLRSTGKQINDTVRNDGLLPLVDELLEHAPGRPERLVVAVDRFGELLTHSAEDHRGRFARPLAEVVRVGAVTVVATARADFIGVIYADPVLSELIPPRIETVLPLLTDRFHRTGQTFQRTPRPCPDVPTAHPARAC